MTQTSDAVFDAQRAFRRLLEATSSPGKILTLPPTHCDSYEEAVALTLLDHEVTFCVVGEGSPTAERLSKQTGARAVPLPEADFAPVYEPGDAASRMKRGEPERPELGATAIYIVESLSDFGTVNLRLSGPGMPDERSLGVAGLPLSEVEAIRESRAGYPLGVDVYLVDPAGRLAGLPRSTRLEVIS